jgi:hypothetical protein
VLNYLSSKAPLSISSHCLQVRLFKGAQYSACPLSFIIYFVSTLFLILPCSQHDEEESSLTYNMCGTDEQPKTADEKAFL